MDALKAQIAAKRKAKEDEFGGKKFRKRGEIEEERIRQKMEEEEREAAEKVCPIGITFPSPLESVATSSLFRAALCLSLSPAGIPRTALALLCPVPPQPSSSLPLPPASPSSPTPPCCALPLFP